MLNRPHSDPLPQGETTPNFYRALRLGTGRGGSATGPRSQRLLLANLLRPGTGRDPVHGQGVRRSAPGDVQRCTIVPVLHAYLPLPGGEGRGEGEPNLPPFFL
jgi:hypothetical protein